jgi:hypothetical protein
MKHRHLTHEGFTLAAIEDILERGSLPDWAPLVQAIEADPHGEVAEKTLRICAACDIYGASKLFSRLIHNARRMRPLVVVAEDLAGKSVGHLTS